MTISDREEQRQDEAETRRAVEALVEQIGQDGITKADVVNFILINESELMEIFS